MRRPSVPRTSSKREEGERHGERDTENRTRPSATQVRAAATSPPSSSSAPASRLRRGERMLGNHHLEPNAVRIERFPYLKDAIPPTNRVDAGFGQLPKWAIAKGIARLVRAFDDAYSGHRERSVRFIVNGSGRSEATLVVFC